MSNYLGHDQLKVQIKDAGYFLTRSGVPALNLSEGEKTAIAFLYFLKSLQDVGFEATKGIVVIDDPVSSLDSNALFSAFGYMKERTKDVGQLFILTHNFAMFRQVKNWFNYLNRRKPRPARFYMVRAFISNDRRCATLTPLDPLLHTFESEYHYLFKQVYDAANSVCGKPLAEYYLFPNLARRLLESFLAFRYPRSVELYAKMQFSSFDEAKRTRLVRFLHTYSHSGFIEEQQHDPTILAETPTILKELMSFIEFEDKKHYEEMVKMVVPIVQNTGGNPSAGPTTKP